jgi:hypothetical protein
MTQKPSSTAMARIRRHSSKENTMRGESVISTTGARGALAGTNAAALQGHASSDGAARTAPAVSNAAQNTAASLEDRNPTTRCHPITQKKALGS